MILCTKKVFSVWVFSAPAIMTTLKPGTIQQSKPVYKHVCLHGVGF